MMSLTCGRPSRAGDARHHVLAGGRGGCEHIVVVRGQRANLRREDRGQRVGVLGPVHMQDFGRRRRVRRQLSHTADVPSPKTTMSVSPSPLAQFKALGRRRRSVSGRHVRRSAVPGPLQHPLVFQRRDQRFDTYSTMTPPPRLGGGSQPRCLDQRRRLDTEIGKGRRSPAACVWPS